MGSINIRMYTHKYSWVQQTKDLKSLIDYLIVRQKQNYEYKTSESAEELHKFQIITYLYQKYTSHQTGITTHRTKIGTHWNAVI